MDDVPLTEGAPEAEGNDRKGLGLVSTLAEIVVLFARIVWTVCGSIVRALFLGKKRKCLRGEVVLITGAAGGLGSCLASRFGREESVVVLWDIDEKGLERVKREIHDEGGWAHAYVCDITNENEVYEVGRRVREEVGDVTMVVNNAGILQNVLFTELRTDKIRKTVEVNLMSHFWINKFFLPRMLQMKKGHIVAISSFSGLRGWLYLADYCATKFAIVGMMEALAEEIRMLGLSDEIHFTTLCPITMNTGMNQNPTTRVPLLVPILDVEETAGIIVDAVKCNDILVTIPRSGQIYLRLSRLLPSKVSHMVLDFLGYNMLPNKKETA